MTRNSRIAFVLLSLILGSLTTPSFAAECRTATQTNCSITLRDNRGIKIGSEDKSSNGSTTIRDNRGIKQGTITTQPGRATCEIIRNSRGIKIGTRGKC